MVNTLLDRAGPRVDRRPDGTAGPASRAAFEPHIQGLRALAVVSVVLYHLWPGRLTGGFVGVDIFFVISGYLICGHLVREINTTGTIRVTRFWARRVRRLIPAALTVLVASAVFVVVAMPAVEWGQNLAEIRAAVLYVENWQLVSNAVDYLAAENSPSLVQHFWSLSVEEQFYFLQPLLLLGALTVFRTRRVVTPLLVAVVALSLPYSIFLTATQPGAAYFSTATRGWEFAAGGLAAVLGVRVALGPRVRSALGWTGLGVIGVALATYSGATPFPGWTAAVPVLGTVLALLFAGAPSRFSPAVALGSAPLRVVGDWSYSIYLWHWPLIVAVPVLLGREAGWKVKVLILVMTVVLAALTKRFIEDRWRLTGGGSRAWRTFVPMVAAATVLALATTGAASFQAARTAADADTARAAIAAASERCLGANAVVNSCDRPYAVTATVVPAVAADDVPWNLGVAASQKCSGGSTTDAPTAHACVFNDPKTPRRTIALIGDSHADHLIDTVNAYATEAGWRLITYTREGCGAIPSARIPDEKCRDWSEAVQKTLQSRTDVDAVIISNYASAEEWSVADAVDTIDALERTGHAVVPMVDVPGMPAGVSAPKCVASHMQSYDPCSTGLPEEGKTEQAARKAGIPAVTLNDILCAGGRCHAVMGGEIVYMDEAHLTFHFAVTLRHVLGARITSAIDGSAALRE